MREAPVSEARRATVDAAFKRVLTPGYAGEAHPGLLLDRGLEDSSAAQSGEATMARAVLFDRVATLAPSALYRDAYARWETLLERRASVRTVKLAVRGTLIVGLGGESVLETGITVQRVYGMPYIPGSALKGLARRYAEGTLTQEDDTPERAKFVPGGAYHDVLFGRPDNAGHVIYHDAWYKPGSAPDDKPFVRDVITVHHPRYYTGTAGKREAPSDVDDPNPIPFVGARGTFLIAVECPDAQWAEAALALLAAALGDLGAGGKTSSGYGRLAAAGGAPVTTPGTVTQPRRQDAGAPAAQRPSEPAATDRAAEMKAKSTELVAEVEALPASEISGKLGDYATQWQALQGNKEAGVPLADAIWRKAGRARDPVKLKQRPWAIDIRDYLKRNGRKV